MASGGRHLLRAPLPPRPAAGRATPRRGDDPRRGRRRLRAVRAALDGGARGAGLGGGADRGGPVPHGGQRPRRPASWRSPATPSPRCCAGPDSVQTNLVVNPSPLAGGEAGEPLVVNGVPYTVERTAQWAPVEGEAASTCDEGTTTELAYLRVRVRGELARPRRPAAGADGHRDDPAQGHLLRAAGPHRSEGRRRRGPPEGRGRGHHDRVQRRGQAGHHRERRLRPASASSTPGRTPSRSPPTATSPRRATPWPAPPPRCRPASCGRAPLEYDEAATLALTFSTAEGHSVPPA